MGNNDNRIIRIVPMAGFQRVDGLTIDSSVSAMIMRLPVIQKEREELSDRLNSPLKRDEAVQSITLTAEEKTKRGTIELQRRLNEVYDRIFNSYNRKIQARFSGEEEKQFDYRTIWDDLARKELDQNNKIVVRYVHRVGKLLGPRTRKDYLTPTTLEDMAESKKKVGKDFYVEISKEDEMKFKALLDLSIKVILSYVSETTNTLKQFENKKEAEEAKEMLKNTYLALYVSGEHIDSIYYDLFTNIGYRGRNILHEKTREVAKYIGELRRNYTIGPRLDYGKKPIRSTRAIAEELEKRKQQENMARLELEVRAEEQR